LDLVGLFQKAKSATSSSVDYPIVGGMFGSFGFILIFKVSLNSWLVVIFRD
jgi:hypothetical protein